MFTISAKLLHQVSAFRADDKEPRYYLAGVHLERDDAGRVLMVATDGHRLLAAHDASALWVFPGGKAFVLDFKLPGFVQALTRAAKADTSRVQWDGVHLEVLEHPRGGGDGALVATYSSPSGHAPMHDANFPEWRRVIPSGELVLGHTTRFNMELLEGLERFGGRYGVSLDFYTSGEPFAPVVVRIAEAPHMVAVIMGTRHNDTRDEALPAFAQGRCWQKPKEPEQVAAEVTAPVVQATATQQVAEWIDPKGALRAAGLLTVVPVNA